jgi:hypothetical protein
MPRKRIDLCERMFEELAARYRCFFKLLGLSPERKSE